MLALTKPGGIIKTTPEDFIVKEVERGKVIEPRFETKLRVQVSPFTRFVLTKRNVDHATAMRELQDQLKVAPDQITTYGRKDKVGVTSQIVVVEGLFRPHFSHSDMWLYQIGPSLGRLSRGGQSGNRFAVTAETAAEQAPHGSWFRNLYGPQRFGDGNVEIGKYLLEGAFDQALAAIKRSWDVGKLQHVVRNYGVTEREALLHFKFQRTIKFRIDQWFSFLWNNLALRYEQRDVTLPFWSLRHAELYKDQWYPDELDEDMFELSHTFDRPVWVEAQDQVVRTTNRGFVHEFTLPSGAFATVFLNTLYNITDASRAHYPDKGVVHDGMFQTYAAE